MNRQLKADLDAPPNVRFGGKADEVRTCQYVLVGAFLVRGRETHRGRGMGPVETT